MRLNDDIDDFEMEFYDGRMGLRTIAKVLKNNVYLLASDDSYFILFRTRPANGIVESCRDVHQGVDGKGMNRIASNMHVSHQ